LVTVDGNSVTTDENSYTFNKVQANHSINVTFTQIPPVPVFDGLKEEYTTGEPAVELKVIGKGSEHLTIFRINGQIMGSTTFAPIKGTYIIEALSDDGLLKIQTVIIVN
jgi:hypothetical protein